MASSLAKDLAASLERLREDVGDEDPPEEVKKRVVRTLVQRVELEAGQRPWLCFALPVGDPLNIPKATPRDPKAREAWPRLTAPQPNPPPPKLSNLG